MKFTFYGHACFAVEANGVSLLFDPFISGNELAAAINLEDIHADYILLSSGYLNASCQFAVATNSTFSN